MRDNQNSEWNTNKVSKVSKISKASRPPELEGVSNIFEVDKLVTERAYAELVTTNKRLALQLRYYANHKREILALLQQALRGEGCEDYSCSDCPYSEWCDDYQEEE